VKVLTAHPPKGVTPRLTAEQKVQVPELLAKGAQAYGFRGDAWTASRVAQVIARTFGVRSHRDHIGQLMREEAGAARSRSSGLVSVMKRLSRRGRKSAGLHSKKAEQERATIVWVDEAGFSFLPMDVRRGAPRGQTPILRVKLPHGHLSAISGITPEQRNPKDG
jgi:hypothetical protein